MMTQLEVKHRDNHFSSADTKDVDRELGDILARYIGGIHPEDEQQKALDDWTQVAKALRLHGLKIDGVKEVLCDGEIIHGPMMLFLNQLFLTAQSFTQYVVDGKLKGRHQADGILEFLDSSINEFRDSTFTFEFMYHPIHDCMTIQKITGLITEDDLERPYYWEWVPTIGASNAHVS